MVDNPRIAAVPVPPLPPPPVGASAAVLTLDADRLSPCP